jgi:PAS domain S-box-containing protein
VAGSPGLFCVKKEIRILILEDVPADVVLINHELRKAHVNFRSQRVETREDFLHQLEHHKPDVVLSDHGLPEFDGFTALAIARDKCPDVPFIFVTSAMGEDFTIQTFESGATDYVLKHQLSKLVPAIQRALREAEAKKRNHEAERALRESEERFRMLVEGVKDYAIYMLDKEGRVTSWNAGAEWMKGYRAQEIMGEPFARFYPPEEVAQHRPEQALRTAAAEGRFEEEGWRMRKGGTKFRAHVVITALRGVGGKLRGFAHVTRNLTGRSDMEEALRKSEALKAALVETALDAMVSIDHEGKVQEWNPAAERIFGYTRADALGRPMDELIIPASLREVYRDGVAHYLMTGLGSLLGRPIELTLRRANGSEFRAELAITRQPREEPPRCTALIRDITERVEAVAALRQSEERFRLLMDGAVDYAIYTLDPEGRVTFWNSGGERLMGYKPEEIIGQPLSRLYTVENGQGHKPEESLREAAATGRFEEENWRVRKDGSRFWANTLTMALRDESGKICGFSRISRDITARHEAEEHVRKLNEQLEERVRERTAELERANQELEAFSYSVSHDLRTPLRHIDGYTEVLQKSAAEKLDAQGRHHLQTISQAAKQMNNLIDHLLEFSRMSRAEMRKIKVGLADLVRAARQDLVREQEGRKIQWVLGPLPEVHGDPFLLRQVMLNLLDNAVKYTRTKAQARIEIGCEATETETRFFVRDNGVGFDMRYADRLFGVFQRLHSAEEFEGTGVGLANVRRIIQRHGGRVWAEGKPGAGATFYFSLPKNDGGEL